jgi:hypothetical protein
MLQLDVADGVVAFGRARSRTGNALTGLAALAGAVALALDAVVGQIARGAGARSGAEDLIDATIAVRIWRP